jgi:hypothetical protein
MGGVTRGTISLVVIIIEITGDLDSLLPIMLVTMVAKWVGDMFIHSIYDMQLHVGNVPFLEPDPPRLAAVMTCQEAMTTGIPVLTDVATVGRIFELLLIRDYIQIAYLHRPCPTH